jgi:hypothetical protein
MGMSATLPSNNEILWRSVHADWRMERQTEFPPGGGSTERLPRQRIATATQPRGYRRQAPK